MALADVLVLSCTVSGMMMLAASGLGIGMEQCMHATPCYSQVIAHCQQHQHATYTFRWRMHSGVQLGPFCWSICFLQFTGHISSHLCAVETLLWQMITWLFQRANLSCTYMVDILASAVRLAAVFAVPVF